MRSDAERIAQYNAKTVPANVALVVTAQLPDMKSGFAANSTTLIEKETLIQNALNAAGIPTIQYPFYLNFGRELYSLDRRGISGTTYVIMAQSLFDKYLAYGLAQGTLLAIAADIFMVQLTP